MGPGPDKDSAPGDHIFDLPAGQIREQKDPRVTLVAPVQFRQCQPVVIVVPHHMRDQRHAVVRGLQNMIDQLPVIRNRDPRLFLIADDHRADVDTHHRPCLKVFRQFRLLRLQGECRIRIPPHIVPHPGLKKGLLRDGLSGCDQRIPLHILHHLRLLKQLRLDGTAPEYRFCPCPVERAVGHDRLPL